MSNRIGLALGSRSQRLALLGIGMASLTVAVLFVVQLSLAPRGGLWWGQGAPAEHLGLNATEAALAVVLVLALLYLTLNAAHWPRLTAGAWALAGMGLGVVTTISALELTDPSTGGVVIDSAGNWSTLPTGGVLALALLFGLQGAAGLTLLLAAQGQLHISSERVLLRCALALPLVLGIYVVTLSFAWRVATPPAGRGSYLTALAIDLIPVLVYAAAAVLLLGGLRQRDARLVLLALTAAYVSLYALLLWEYAPYHHAVLSLYAMLVVAVPLMRRASSESGSLADEAANEAAEASRRELHRGQPAADSRLTHLALAAALAAVLLGVPFAAALLSRNRGWQWDFSGVPSLVIDLGPGTWLVATLAGLGLGLFQLLRPSQGNRLPAIAAALGALSLLVVMPLTGATPHSEALAVEPESVQSASPGHSVWVLEDRA